MLGVIAQAADAATVSNTVSLLERILQGGVPLICLCVAVLCGAGFYWQLKRNTKQSEDAVQKAEAATRERVAETSALLREMLERDREAQEAQSAATAAVEGFTRALQEHTRVEEESRRTLQELLDVVRACETRRSRV